MPKKCKTRNIVHPHNIYANWIKHEYIYLYTLQTTMVAVAGFEKYINLDFSRE